LAILKFKDTSALISDDHQTCTAFSKFLFYDYLLIANVFYNNKLIGVNLDNSYNSHCFRSFIQWEQLLCSILQGTWPDIQHVFIESSM
jgi:hypothetical protein